MIDKEFKLTRKQKMFADKYIENGGNGVKASMEVYEAKNYNTHNVIAVENLQKPTIRHYLSTKGDQAGMVIESIMNDEEVNPTTRLNAATYIFDQVHGRATQKVESKQDITIDIKTMSDEELLKLVK